MNTHPRKLGHTARISPTPDRADGPRPLEYIHSYQRRKSDEQRISAPSPVEPAIANLLRLVLYPHAEPAGLGLVGGVPGGRGVDHTVARLPLFLSGGGPRDQRGCVTRKSLHLKVQQLLEGGEGGAMEDAERERHRELLGQLKSPDVPETPNTPGITVGSASGSGTNAPRENRPIAGYVVDDREEDHGVDDGLGSLRAVMAMGGGEGTLAPNWQRSEERMDNWDEAQEAVERMVGTATAGSGGGE